MTWDIDTAKRRLGITDDASDDDLTSAMAVALSIAESYCDRRFPLADDTQEFTPPINCTLLVRRYPIASIKTLAPLDPQPDPAPDPVAVPPTWRMDKKRGIIFMVGAPAGWSGVNVMPVGSTPAPYGIGWPGRGFVLAYSGGYDPLPADLEAALWMVFDNVWNSTPGWGMPAGAGGSGSGAVRSFSIDGMSIGYDTGSSGSSGAGRAEAYGMIPASAAGILDFYRAESAAIGA